METQSKKNTTHDISLVRTRPFHKAVRPSARERFAEVIWFTCGIVVRDVDAMTLTKVTILGKRMILASGEDAQELAHQISWWVFVPKLM